jgi:glutathione S-transferase
MTDYTLYYWPIPFRGHFVRYALARAGVSWDEPGFEAVAALRAAGPAEQPTPFMGPPVLIDNASGQALSQMPAIVMHLGRAHGLLDDEDRTLRLLCDANDVLYEITRAHGAMMWDRESWSAFTAERLPRWMRMHERLAGEGLGSGKGFLSGGGEPGLSDIALAALWHTMADRLPGIRAPLEAHAPALMELCDRVVATPAIARMLAGWQDRLPLYCGGEIEASILAMLNQE